MNGFEAHMLKETACVGLRASMEDDQEGGQLECEIWGLIQIFSKMLSGYGVNTRTTLPCTDL